MRGVAGTVRRLRRLPAPIRAAAASVAVLALIELLLRLAGFPQGTFAPLFPPRGGLYPESATVRMNWGPIPYVVRSNALGLRGEEIPREKAPGTLRVVTIGDSVTDGFFVDNEATWQYVLEARLEAELGRRVEVVNCARGGGSIDKELSLLRRHGLPLRPDVVVLTFVTNDISEISGKSREQILAADEPGPRERLGPAVTRFLLTRTGVGEAVFTAYLTVRSPSFRKKQHRISRRRYDDSRYAIDGGADYDKNAAEFLARFHSTDGLVLGNEFDAPTTAALERYAEVLGVLHDECRRHGAKLLFVYCPAYAQIYGHSPSRRINGALAAHCARLGIPFIDLTDGFAAVGRSAVFHLAPLDHHFNPAGNRLFAELVSGPLAALATEAPRSR